MTLSAHPQQRSTDLSSRYAVEAGENDIAVILKILIERFNIIVLCMALAVFLAVFYTSQIKITYIASTKVMLTSNTAVKQSNVLQTLFKTGKLDIADLLSQIQIMQSPDVIRLLVINQNLYRDPEFGGDETFENFEQASPQRQQAIVSIVKSHLKVSPVLGTSIVEISYESSDRNKSSMIANALSEAYSDNEQNKSKEMARVATEWLSDRLEVLREDVRKTEIALESAREENNLTLSQSGDSRLTKIELLNRQLSEAQGKHEEIKGIIELIEEAKKKGQRLDAIPKFLSDRLAENLKTAEAGLVRKRAILERRYGPNHPEMIALRAEFQAFQGKLNDEVEIFVESLRNQTKIQEFQIAGLDEQITNYITSYRGDSEKRLKIKNLQTELNTSRSLLNSFTSSYLESLQSLNIDRNPVRVISPAVPPSRSAVPNKMLIIMLSGITGLFLGMFIALVLERVQNVLQTPHQIEKLLGMSVYAVLPKVKMNKDTTPFQYIFDNPASALAELVRSMFVSLQLRDPHKKSGGRVVTVTSTNTGEGKTTTTMWLATVAAQSGKKVLIIDTDMRRPSLHKAYGLGNARGLADYLSDRSPLDDTIYKKHGSGVHIMTSKAIPTHAITLLGSERMETLLRRVRDMYDLILLDCPTSRVFSDARVMANLSDKTLYVVEWKKTTRDDLSDTVKLFTDMNYTNMSFILNKVDDKKLIHFGKDEMAYMNQ